MNNKSSKINSIIKKMSSIVVVGLLAISSIGAVKAPIDNSPKTSNLTSPYTEQELETPLTFTALTADSKVTLKKGSNPSWEGQYSTDGGDNWYTYTLGTQISLSSGETVSFKGNISGNFSSTNYLWFVMSGDISASGNINSMYDSDGFSTLTELGYKYCYYKLFDGCSALTDVSHLLLPAEILSEECYRNMFKDCTSLTTAPELPAETLATSCYHGMFNGCKSLTTVPALPAEKLASNCYYSMFNGCTSLTTAPALPAETLASSCYVQMFNGCTSLTIAPALPAKELKQNCYAQMFNGCKSLTTVPALPAETLASSCYVQMFNGCSSLVIYTSLNVEKYATKKWEMKIEDGTAANMFGNTQGSFKENGTPNSGNKITLYIVDQLIVPLTFTAIETDSTVTLSKVGSSPSWTGKYCKDSVGENTCSTKLYDQWITYEPGTTGAITLTNAGDKVSFIGDIGANFDSNNYLKFAMTGGISASGNINSLHKSTNFEKVGIDSSDQYKLIEYCYRLLFYNCTALTDTSNLLLPATTLAGNCYNSMFYGCTGLTDVSDLLLPATTLADNCYNSMFYGCTGLTDVSDLLLPATTLAGNCYNSMFYGCTSLIAAPELPATTLANNCYSYMFRGCTSLTTAPELPATTLANNCYYSMFQNCTNLTATPALPAENLAEYCYGWMFYGCSNLEEASALPATTLANSCYVGMFSGCKKLESTPELLATILAESCYSSMFQNCTSLTTAPELPATTLAKECYQFMFNGCENLEIHNKPSEGFAKELTLPATTATGAVTNMFKGTKGFYSTGEGTPDLTSSLTLYVAGGEYVPPAPIIGGGIIIELPTTLDPNYDPTTKPEEPVVIKIKLLLTSDNLIYDDSNHTLYVGDLPDDVTYTITGELYYNKKGSYYISANFIYDEDKYALIESISKTFTIA